MRQCNTVTLLTVSKVFQTDFVRSRQKMKVLLNLQYHTHIKQRQVIHSQQQGLRLYRQLDN